MYKSLKLLSLLASGLAAVGCQEFDGGFDADAIKHAEYANNFEKTYGSIKDIPTWDFSSYNLRQMGLEGGPSYAGMTRGLAPNYSGSVNTNTGIASDILKSNAPSDVNLLTDGWYSVPSATLSWLDKSLPEGREYTQGESFVLGKPQDNFAIIPIYQGHAGMCWELHLVDKATNNDYKLWEKSQGIRYNVDFDADNAIDVAHREIIEWNAWIDTNNDNEPDKDTGRQEMLIPIGYILKAWESSFGDLVLSCDLPDGCFIKGRIVDNSAEGQGKVVNLDNDGNGFEFTKSGKQTYTIPTYALETIKERNLADNIYFELWWNDGWKEGGNMCHFGFYWGDRATFHLTTVTKSEGNHIGKLYLEGRTSNEVGHTVGKAAAGVEARPILIDGSKIQGDMYLYLKITQQDKDNPGYAPKDACQRSDENMMVALPIGIKDGINGVPDNIGDNEYMIIGCEDANNTGSSGTDNSDWDYNDIVFLLVGQGGLPKVKEVIAEKRYMIEDLGSTFDFDFNDIVVDVTQTRVTDYKGDAVGENDGKTTTAVIRHLCGTIPFQIHIGNTDFDVLPGKVNCNPALDPDYSGKYEKADVDWNPNTNNITVTVWPTKAGESGDSWSDSEKNNFLGLYSEQSETFGFPESGEFPYIIACDQNVNWMEENISVPESWFKTWPGQYYDYNGKPRPTPTDPVTPPTPPASTTVDLPSDIIGEGWNVTMSENTVTFNANWAGFQWWYGNANFSEYSKIVVTYTRASGSENLPLQLVVEYTTENGTNDKEETIYQQSVSGLVTNGSTLEVTLSNEYKSGVRQIFIQNGEGTGSITVTRAYAEK